MKGLIAIALCSAGLVLSGCTGHAESAGSQEQNPGEQLSVSDTEKASCLDAAREGLGPSAQVLRCGHLTGRKALDVIAAIRLKGLRDDADGVPVSTLVILHQTHAQWSRELVMDKDVKNPEGYLGKFIYDSDISGRYRVSFSNNRSDGSQGFSIYYYYLNPQKQVEGSGAEISWNPAVQRFQAYEANDEPVGFKSEIKSPKRIKPCGACKN
jgi:hypothetical protein